MLQSKLADKASYMAKENLRWDDSLKNNYGFDLELHSLRAQIHNLEGEQTAKCSLLFWLGGRVCKPLNYMKDVGTFSAD